MKKILISIDRTGQKRLKVIFFFVKLSSGKKPTFRHSIPFNTHGPSLVRTVRVSIIILFFEYTCCAYWTRTTYLHPHRARLHRTGIARDGITVDGPRSAVRSGQVLCDTPSCAGGSHRHTQDTRGFRKRMEIVLE